MSNLWFVFIIGTVWLPRLSAMTGMSGPSAMLKDKSGFSMGFSKGFRA